MANETMSRSQTPAGASSFTLDRVLDLRAAEGLRERLMHVLGDDGPVSIDASQVARVSTGCIQVFVAFVLAAQKAEVALILKRSSPAFDAALDSLGLSGVMAGIHRGEAA